VTFVSHHHARTMASVPMDGVASYALVDHSGQEKIVGQLLEEFLELRRILKLSSSR